MSQVEVPKSRRRGEVLREAILDAAWEELGEHAWSGFRIDRVAERAGTGKAVIYRRWPNKAALVRAASLRVAAGSGSAWTSAGDLRQDLIDFLDGAARFIDGPFGEALRGLTAEPELPADSKSPQPHGLAVPAPGIVTSIVEQARISGALGRAEPSPLVLNVGALLVNQQYLSTGSAPTHELVIEIVDTVWLPALRAACSGH